MSKCHSSFASKPWITTAIANSIKAKISSTKNLVKKKTQNKGKFMDSSLKLWYYKEPSYNITKSCIQRMNIAKLIFRKIKKT